MTCPASDGGAFFLPGWSQSHRCPITVLAALCGASSAIAILWVTLRGCEGLQPGRYGCQCHYFRKQLTGARLIDRFLSTCWKGSSGGRNDPKCSNARVTRHLSA